MSFVKILDEKIFFQNMKKGHFFRPSDASVLFIQKGYIDVEINNNEPIHFQRSQLIFILHNNYYKLTDFSENLNMFSISFNRDKIRSKVNFDFSTYDAYRLTGAKKKMNVFPVSEKLFVHLLAMLNQLQFYQEDGNRTIYGEKIILHIVSAMLYIITSQVLMGLNLSKSKNSRQEEITMQFLSLLSQNYKREKELAFYAEKMHISVKYLSICVKNITGNAPTVFIAESLLDEAKRTLINTNASISSIAYALNFSDQYAFGKFFKKHTHLSPRNYRKELKKIHTI